jgi:hypothetical protein
MLLWSPWKNWRCLDNEKKKVEKKISNAVKDLELLYAELKKVQTWLDAEKKEVKNAERCPYGYTEPFFYEISSQDIFYVQDEILQDVDGSWRSSLSDKFLGVKKQRPTLREKMNLPDHPKGASTGYMNKEDLNKYGLAINTDELDQVMAYKDSGGNSSSSNKPSRKKRPNESQEDHQSRLNKMDKNS